MATGVSADKRLFLARLAEARDVSQGGPKKRAIQRTAGVLVIVVLLVALLLWLSGFFSTPKEVLEIRAMVDKQIVQLQKVARNEIPLTYDNSDFRQNWPRMRDMPEGLRDQLRNEMERLARAREQAERQSYFAMPPQERQKELDRRIKAEESRRQTWQQQRGNRNGGNGPNAGQQPSGTGGQANAARSGQGRGGAGGGATQAGAAGARGGPGGGAPRGGRGGSEDARNARSKQRIDSTSPEERAQSVEYRRAMDVRRQQLGLSPGRGRGG